MKAKKISILIISGLLVLLFSTTTWARDQSQNRQYNQRNRIKQGLESGKITKHENKKLQKEQQRIRQYTRKAGRDGEFTRHEKRTIARMRDRAGKHIYKAKHNRPNRNYNNYFNYKHNKYHSHGSNRCYRSHCGHYSGYYPYIDGFHFSGTWFEPGGFFSFSTGGEW